MWNIPSKKRLQQIPKLYETEDIELKNKLIYLHFFIGGCDWYIAEYDGDDLFWGYTPYQHPVGAHPRLSQGPDVLFICSHISTVLKLR